MNATLQAKSAYTSNQTAIRTPRSIEAQLLGTVTAELRNASSKKEYRKIVSALHRNRQMWTTFAVNIADNDNELPDQLRAQLFYLSEFTEHHSQKVLKGEADVSALVDINMSILKGLTGVESIR